jgi:protein ImuB
VVPHLPADRLLRRGRTQPRSGAPAEGPLAVIDKHRGALVLVAVDAAAARLGLVPGLPLTTARALHPGLAVAEADPDADAALLAAVADWCERYTPLVGLDGEAAVALDIGGSAGLFGGEEAMLGDALARLRRQGFQARGAIAGTRSAARALARFGGEDSARAGIVVRPGAEAAAVAPLPVEALGLSEAASVAIGRLGFRTVGQLAASPRAPLAARFGADLLARLDRLQGQDEEPISPRRPLPACIAERRFAEPIGHEDDVRRSMAALATELAGILERRGEGARRLAFAFFRADGAVRRIAAETGRPVRDPAAVQRLFRERLDGLADPLDPGFGFDVIRLEAEHVERLDAAQAGLDGQARDEEALADLVDRLCARFGLRRVRRLMPQDSHDPERASIAIPAQRGAAALDWSAWAQPEEEPPARPLRLLDRPERIEAVAEVPDGPPIRFRWRRLLHEVRRAEGPERIAPEWWRREPGTPTRDYFRVEDAQGRRFWLYREGLFGRETASPRWYLHGVFG